MKYLLGQKCSGWAGGGCVVVCNVHVCLEAFTCHSQKDFKCKKEQK